MLHKLCQSPVLSFLIASGCIVLSESLRKHNAHRTDEHHHFPFNFFGSGVKRSELQEPLLSDDFVLSDDFGGQQYAPLSRDFVHPRFTQVFDITRKTSPLRYEAKLEEFMAGNKEAKISGGLDKDLQIVMSRPKVSLHHRMEVQVGNETYNFRTRHIPGTNTFGSRSWRLVPEGRDEDVLFTIQRGHWFLPKKFICTLRPHKCKITWNIYRGRKKDKKKGGLVVQKDPLEKSNEAYKFFRDSDFGEAGPERDNWVAKAVYKSGSSGNNERRGFQVFVQPSADAALIIVATIGMNYLDDPLIRSSD